MMLVFLFIYCHCINCMGTYLFRYVLRWMRLRRSDGGINSTCFIRDKVLWLEYAVDRHLYAKWFMSTYRYGNVSGKLNIHRLLFYFGGWTKPKQVRMVCRTIEENKLLRLDGFIGHFCLLYVQYKINKESGAAHSSFNGKPFGLDIFMHK